MKKTNYTLTALLISLFYWIIESVIHWRIFLEAGFELIPSEFNELWMRIIIIILFLSFGIYADYQTKKLLKKEEEKERIYFATVRSTQHILNNLLNQLQILRIEADNNPDFNKEIKLLFEGSLKEGQLMVKRLSSIEELTEENIRNSVLPEEIMK
ncbi:MAG: hypothetical protein OEV42_18195 [Deltaproteobacteria bacterium]|nr:hypothetical protein [Deltaproteobacteria bacterium]